MKALLIILLTFCSSVTLAKTKTRHAKLEKLFLDSKQNRNFDKLAFELERKKLFFSSVNYARYHLVWSEKLDDEFLAYLDRALSVTGVESLVHLKHKTLKKITSSVGYFLRGKKYYASQSFAKVIPMLGKVEKTHRLFPESLLVRGVSLGMLDQNEEAKKEFDRCTSIAEKFENLQKREKLKRYFAYIKETCLINKTRIVFEEADYAKALEHYEKIPKVSYRWPYVLLEKAWSSYHLQDYNRSLGLLTTYKSPLMSDYFFPEAEFLTAISYFQLCLWDDALTVIQKFDAYFRPETKKLEFILKKFKKSKNFFFKLATGEKDNDKTLPFAQKLVTQVKKQVKFSLDITAYEMARIELEAIEESSLSKPFKEKLKKSLWGALKRKRKDINHFVKIRMFHFINNIRLYAGEMFNVKLEIMAKKRDLLYKNKELVADRSRGSQDNVNRKPDQYFWQFHGAFWADELGDYSFGLKSNCEEVSTTQKRASL